MALSLALILAQVAAQPAPPPEPTVQTPEEESRADTGRLAPADTGEIVVTARRRAETVQQVPIAMSVIGAIQRTGLMGPHGCPTPAAALRVD